MGALLKIVDEHFGPGGAERRPAVELRLVSERTTARDIIHRRVEAEVEAVNSRRLAVSAETMRTRSLLIDVDPASAEGRLNSLIPRFRRKRPIDADAEATRAFEAFKKRRFLLLFDDRQIDDLDEVVTARPESQVVFLYLTPLKGG